MSSVILRSVEILRPKSLRTAVLENVAIQISYETPELLIKTHLLVPQIWNMI